jgi:transcriptional repressor NrdR
MKCPKCGSFQDHIVDTRPKKPTERWRRRECLECGHRWNTIETYEKEVREWMREKKNAIERM